MVLFVDHGVSFFHLFVHNLKSNIFRRLLGDKSSNGVSNSLFCVLGVKVSLSLSVSVTSLSDSELIYHVVLDLEIALLFEGLGKVLLL